MSSQTFDYPFGTSASYAPYWLTQFSLQVQDLVIVSSPSLGGPIRTYELPGTWLVVRMTYPPQNTAERREIQGWWAKAGLRKNRVRLYHPLYVAPAGTMRGSPLVKTTAAAGAESVAVKAMGGTLLRGDFIGLTDGLHIVTDDATPAGSEATVNISPPLRAQVLADSAVAWDKPTQTFVVVTAPEIAIEGSGPHPGFTVQLVEAP